MSRARALSLLAAGALACASMTASAISEEEQRARIIYEADQATHLIDELGILYTDPVLDAYLQGIVDKLFPESGGKLVIRVFKATSFNAFAMSNGRLFIHTGTLLRLKDEAELASVLGHEGSHVFDDHIYRSVTSAKITMPILTVLGSALGAGSLGQLAGVSSIMGMSRAHEREADIHGFQRLVKAGYDASGATETFRRLLRELESMNVKQPMFFASHPAVQDRIANYMAMSKQAPPGGEKFANEYLVQTASARVAALDNILREGNGKLLVHLLEREDLLATLPPFCRYHLAEGFRLRNAEGDREKSLAAYRETLAAAPDYAPTYAALGKRLMHDGDKAGALPLLRKYLELEPDSVEKGFIELYITTLEKETAQ